MLFLLFTARVQSRPPGPPLVPEVFTFTRLGSLKFLCLSPIIRAVLWAMDAHFFKDQSFFSQVIRQIIFKIKVFSSTCFMSQNYCKTSARFIWKVFVLNSLLPGKVRTFGTLGGGSNRSWPLLTLTFIILFLSSLYINCHPLWVVPGS